MSPQNNSWDRIGTYWEIANYSWSVAFSASRTLTAYWLPTSSIQWQSSDQDLAVGDSEAACLRMLKLFTAMSWRRPGFSGRHCQNV